AYRRFGCSLSNPSVSRTDGLPPERDHQRWTGLLTGDAQAACDFSFSASKFLRFHQLTFISVCLDGFLATVLRQTCLITAGENKVRATVTLVHRPNSCLYYSNFRLHLRHAESGARYFAHPANESDSGAPGTIAVHSAESGTTQPDYIGCRCGKKQSANCQRTRAPRNHGEQMASLFREHGARWSQ